MTLAVGRPVSDHRLRNLYMVWASGKVRLISPMAILFR